MLLVSVTRLTRNGLLSVKVEALLSKYEWIATDRQYFGQPNTAYDFGANDPKEVARRLTKLQEQKVRVYSAPALCSPRDGLIY